MGEESATAITIDGQFIDEINLTVEAHVPAQGHNNETTSGGANASGFALAPAQSSQSRAEDQKKLLKSGLLMIFVAFGAIKNPPLIVNANIAHTLLSNAFSFAIYMNLAIGMSQILVSMLLHRAPKLIWAAKKLMEVGLVLLKITLAFGTSLLLMVSSSPWFVLYGVHLYVQH